MNKNRIIATAISAVLLIAAILFKFLPSGQSTAVYALPILTVGVWAIVVFDTIAFRQEKGNRLSELIRLVSFYLIAVLVTFGTVLYLLFYEPPMVFISF